MTVVTTSPDPMAYAAWWTSGRRSPVTMTAADADRAPGTSPSTWAEDLWNTHGQQVYALACALSGDTTAAMQTVAHAMVDLLHSGSTGSTDDTARTLALLVYRRSTQAEREPVSADLPPVMVRLSELAQLQRGAIALCAFGGFTYQEVAELLEIPAPAVAQLLAAGLDELGHPARPAIIA